MKKTLLLSFLVVALVDIYSRSAFAPPATPPASTPMCIANPCRAGQVPVIAGRDGRDGSPGRDGLLGPAGTPGTCPSSCCSGGTGGTGSNIY